MADKKISELDQALQINNDAVFPISQDNGGTDTTYKVSITQISAEVGEDQTFSNLDTTDKTLVGAINEVAAGGTTDYEDLSNKPQVNSVELVGNKSLDDLGIMPASLSKTVSGSIAHITDGGDNIPVKSLASEIVAVQAGSGVPSTNNVRGISGFDNGVVSVCGVNVFDEVFETGDISFATGGNITGASWIRSSNYVPIVSGLTIYVKSAQNINIFFYDYNKAYLGNNSEGLKSNVKNTEITISSKARYFRIATNQTTYNNDISINYPSSDTSYHTYNGNTYTFAFGQTVYGGKLIYANGQWSIKLTQKYFSYNEVVYYGIYGADNANLYYMEIPNYATEIIKNISSSTHIGGLMSNILTKISTVLASGMNNNEIRTQDSSIPRYFYFRADGFANLADLNTYLANTPLQVVAELSTPITLPITGQDIPTLLECNIFSNCGDIEVEYFTEKANAIAELIKAFM